MLAVCNVRPPKMYDIEYFLCLTAASHFAISVHFICSLSICDDFNAYIFLKIWRH